jgi:hypothetical protein
MRASCERSSWVSADILLSTALLPGLLRQNVILAWLNHGPHWNNPFIIMSLIPCKMSGTDVESALSGPYGQCLQSNQAKTTA